MKIVAYSRRVLVVSPQLFNAPVCGGNFKTTIKRLDWGVDFLVKEGMVDNMILKIKVEAIK